MAITVLAPVCFFRWPRGLEAGTLRRTDFASEAQAVEPADPSSGQLFFTWGQNLPTGLRADFEVHFGIVGIVATSAGIAAEKLLSMSSPPIVTSKLRWPCRGHYKCEEDPCFELGVPGFGSVYASGVTYRFFDICKRTKAKQWFRQ